MDFRKAVFRRHFMLWCMRRMAGTRSRLFMVYGLSVIDKRMSRCRLRLRITAAISAVFITIVAAFGILQTEFLSVLINVPVQIGMDFFHHRIVIFGDDVL